MLVIRDEDQSLQDVFCHWQLHFLPFRLCVGGCAGAAAFAGARWLLTSVCTATVTVFGVPEAACSLAGSGDKRRGHPCVYCRGDNGVVLKRSGLYEIKLSAPVLTSSVFSKSVVSLSELKRVLCQKFAYFFPAAAFGLINDIGSTLKTLFCLHP